MVVCCEPAEMSLGKEASKASTLALGISLNCREMTGFPPRVLIDAANKTILASVVGDEAAFV
jgi:hypothetical protein